MISRFLSRGKGPRGLVGLRIDLRGSHLGDFDIFGRLGPVGENVKTSFSAAHSILLRGALCKGKQPESFSLSSIARGGVKKIASIF